MIMKIFIEHCKYFTRKDENYSFFRLRENKRKKKQSLEGVEESGQH